MYALWSKADSNFAAVSPQFPGVRMLNQDPVENVFSFICSSNNNIQRYGNFTITVLLVLYFEILLWIVDILKLHLLNCNIYILFYRNLSLVMN